MVKHFLGLIILVNCLLVEKGLAQIDTLYYVSYDTMLAARVYFSQKYTNFRFVDRNEDIRIHYLPNTTLNLGVGATYKIATLNFAYGFGFLNPDRDQGETKYLDLQCHIYGQGLLIDLFGQFYRGFHLRNDELRDAEGSYYYRPDIRVQQIGFSGYWIVNKDRFSYRAGFLQNEWQKKSAGSFLLGWQLLFGGGTSDSTIVPSNLYSVPPVEGTKRLSFVETGPSAGYAYTLVIKKHFFIMASATITVDFSVNVLESPERVRSTSLVPNFGIKAFAGYNSRKSSISLTFTNETVNLAAGKPEQLFGLNTGNLRLNFVHRFAFEWDFIPRQLIK